jgi:hypothetical protein
MGDDGQPPGKVQGAIEPSGTIWSENSSELDAPVSSVTVAVKTKEPSVATVGVPAICPFASITSTAGRDAVVVQR